MKKICQGAEAVLYRKGNELIKDRVSKKYRIKELDERIRKLRTREEARLLSMAKRAGVNAPQVLTQENNKIIMEFVEGKVLRDYLDSAREWKTICRKIGKSIARLHSHNIIHGDLTTSNMIWKNDAVYFIDFGLGFYSKRVEDMAVDLHVLEEALTAKHYRSAEKFFKTILNEYAKTFKKGMSVVVRLEKVKKRGRYL